MSESIKKIGIPSATIASALLLMAPMLAIADNPHFIGTPKLTKNPDGSISVTFKAAGLGTGQYDVFLTADEVTMVLQCVNPSGKNEPAGQNPPPDLNVVGPTKTVDARNGQLTVGPPGVILPAPETPTPEEAGCKSSPGWTVRVVSITFEDVVLHVQPVGSDTDVLSFSFGNVQTFPQ
jgi:hypothetical protein